MSNQVLVLGGAGFVGSHVVKRFFKEGFEITVIDGLLPGTGARMENLGKTISNISFFPVKVEEFPNFDALLRSQKMIIDCMGWSSHLEALETPAYDLKLNLYSHLYFIKKLRQFKNSRKKIIYLGSRGQYGNVNDEVIFENTPMNPLDVQGIHKLAAESLYRVYSSVHGFDVLSLRFPNCYGENQPFLGRDIGLIGGFIKALLNDEIVSIFGENRKRNLVYAGDIAEVIFQLAQKPFEGFCPVNVAGHYLEIKDIVILLKNIIRKGGYRVEDIPAHIQRIDMSSVPLSESRLKQWLGDVPLSSLENSFAKTVDYFQGVLK